MAYILLVLLTPDETDILDAIERLSAERVDALELGKIFGPRRVVRPLLAIRNLGPKFVARLDFVGKDLENARVLCHFVSPLRL